MTRRVNEILNPLFHGDKPYATSNSCTADAITHENGRRYIRAYDLSGGDPYVDFASLQHVAPGSYRFRCELYAQGGQGCLRIFQRNENASSYTRLYELYVNDGVTKLADTTLQLSGRGLLFRIVPVNTDSMVMLCRPLLELESTYDPELWYFDYSTMPRGLGGGLT
ncbi:hypothetical protein [Bifidobacterium phasiani]|uniref:Uncharacterized protein n=1 Tax=Bifidobacterium phasiani TaxID=2834431 RepID=A0ABS6W647_9BIFI|nr:hypothetical protein [Bifidobacterium phasiani]MBW3081958.1 hypothetical protein [Bifidobacterium phasiani]